MWVYTQGMSSDELMHWASGQAAPKHKWIDRIKTSKGYKYIYNHSSIAQKKEYANAKADTSGQLAGYYSYKTDNARVLKNIQDAALPDLRRKANAAFNYRNLIVRDSIYRNNPDYKKMVDDKVDETAALYKAVSDSRSINSRAFQDYSGRAAAASRAAKTRQAKMEVAQIRYNKSFVGKLRKFLKLETNLNNLH